MGLCNLNHRSLRRVAALAALAVAASVGQVHTSAAIFAFGGSALLGTSMYVVQRTCRARLFGGEALANFVFWGYQFFIVMAALSYVMGFSQGKEYAEPEWYADLWLTADEIEGIGEQLAAALKPYRERVLEGQRPEGSRRVRAMNLVIPHKQP